MKSLFSMLCKQTAGKRVKEETGNFYWKQLYLLVHFTKLASMFLLCMVENHQSLFTHFLAD